MTEQEHRFPCHSCGADMRFAPTEHALICDHCGAKEPFSETSPWENPSREMDYQAALEKTLPEDAFEETRTVTCSNCAAEIEFDANTHAKECPFCATPVVTDTGINRHIKPRGLLSFALEEQDARKEMGNWLGKLWFAPNGLQDFARKGRPMQGVYVPYWTFDAQTASRYTGKRGDDYYVSRTVIRDGKPTQVRERRTRWRNVAGRVSRFFDDILISASRSIPKKDAENLGPWALSDLIPYRPEYLAGFRAESYSVNLDDGFSDARDHMDRVIRRDIRFDIGGDHQRIETVNTKVSDVTFKHILLPVWLAAYNFRGETYRVLVNGHTGKVSGQRPWSVWKITIAVILSLLVAGAIGYGISISESGTV